MSLHGNHMTLACFHGPNFRSKSWALFHLEEPNIAFWTEAQKIWEDGKLTHFKLLLFSSCDVIIHSRVTFLSHIFDLFSLKTFLKSILFVIMYLTCQGVHCQ